VGQRHWGEYEIFRFRVFHYPIGITVPFAKERIKKNEEKS
jgi:hypothetical protein